MRAAPDPLVVEASIVVVDRPVIRCTVCWSGDTLEGERVIAPLRAFGPPAADAIVNYLSQEDDEAVRAAYQSHIARLILLKRRYDPSNVFRMNRNIRP
jgi:hypothetical protein